MDIRVMDSPQPPLRPPSGPQQPQSAQTQRPMVYVYEKQEWEYKIIAKDAAKEELLSEHDLNALGTSGWELVAVLALPGTVQFYFKRVRK